MRPLVHLGRLPRTVFLCNYLLNDGFRRELLRVINRGEAVNALSPRSTPAARADVDFLERRLP